METSELKDNSVAFVVTNHFSQRLRPAGRKYIKEYIKSLQESCDYNYSLYLIDNGSSEQIDSSIIQDSQNRIKCFFIPDQTKRGITGAWNYGIYNAYKDSHNIIINTNDDITFDKTINSFIHTIINHPYKHMSIFGPVANIGGCPGPNKQERTQIGNRILEVTQTDPNSWNNMHGINGFFNAFTRECFEKFNVNNNMYSADPKYKIAGQEAEMQTRLGKQGLRSFIIESCMVHHKKIRGWQQLQR